MAEHHEHLILKLLRGTITSAEKRELDSWIGESPENRRVAEDLQQVWKLSKSDPATHAFNTEQEWSRFEASVARDRENSPAGVVRVMQTVWFRVAALLTLLAVCAFIFYLTFFAAREVVHNTADNTLAITLPDGSQVWLNAQSRLAYDADFSKGARAVELEGEAFFEVKKDAGRPFIVSTARAQVKVLGTSFDVSAYSGDQTRVLVVTGRVSFSALKQHDEEAVVLAPGEAAALNARGTGLSRTVSDDINALAWKEKRLVFRKAALGDVIRTLKQYFKTEITLRNKDMLRCRFTSTFNDPTLEEVVEVLSESLNLDVVHQQGMVILDGKGC